MCPVGSPLPRPLSVPSAAALPTAQQARPPEPHSFAAHPPYSQLSAHPHSYPHSHLPQQLWHQTHIPLQSSRGRNPSNPMHHMHSPSHTHHTSAQESQHAPQHHFQEPNQPSQSHSLTALVHPTVTSAQMQVSPAIPQASVSPQIPPVLPRLQQQQSTSGHSPSHSQHQVVPPPHPPPPPPHSDRAHHPVHYQHTVNVVAQHRPPHPYVYTVHHPQIMGPVAHVPIGAAPYAHLPPSVWSPAHPSYHPSGAIPPVGQHVQVHPSHHPAASQLHHISSQPAPPHPLYSHPIPQTSVPHTSIHRTTMSPQTYVYQYSHMQQPPPPTSHPGTHVKEHKIGPPSSAPHYSHVPPVVVPAESTNGFVKREEKADAMYTNNASHFEGSRGPPVAERQKQRLNDRAALPYTPSCQSKYMAGGAKASSSQMHQNNCNSLKGANGAHMLAEDAKKSPQRSRSQHSPGQPIRKPRKPYTITKSREVWTPEEHNRFLNALQLYDRDWKKIESYIGTKTVLQIRSHAQKHFGKVTKYKTGEYIPPPRPKKKATSPYPRSRPSSGSKSGSGSGGSGSDSGAATELGLASGTGSMNGSVTTGNHSESLTVPSQILEHNRTQSKNTILQQQKPAAAPPESNHHSSRGAQSPYYNNPRGNLHRQDGQISTQKLPPLQSWTRSRLSDIVENDTSHRNTTKQLDLADGTGSVQQNSRERTGGNKVDDANSHVDGRVMAQHSSSQHNGEVVPVQRKADDTGSQLHAAQNKQFVNGNAKDSPSVPNTSLQVLSTVVDMVQKDAPPERSPAAGWATAAAARRAHRAKVIRARKPPLPTLASVQGEPGNGRKPQVVPADSSGRGDCERMPQNRGAGSERDAAKSINENHPDCPRPPTPCANISQARENSPPTAPHSNEAHCMDRDTQIRPPGLTSNSDHVISEFSASRRSSVGDIITSNGGGGIGGSLENSDTGEVEPKSSNDGSGDDVNRQSPSTRDSSPGDPASSGSRENTPNTNSSDGNDGGVPSPREHCPMGATKEGQHAPTSDPVSQTPLGGRNGADETIKNVAVGGRESQKIAAESDATQAGAPGNGDTVNTGPDSKIPVSASVSITRRPQTIANLCSAAPEEICSADDSRKRPRSIIREGLAVQNSENGNDEREDSSKRRRRSMNSSVGALLNKTQDPQSKEPDATMVT